MSRNIAFSMVAVAGLGLTGLSGQADAHHPHGFYGGHHHHGHHHGHHGGGFYGGGFYGRPVAVTPVYGGFYGPRYGYGPSFGPGYGYGGGFGPGYGYGYGGPSLTVRFGGGRGCW